MDPVQRKKRLKEQHGPWQEDMRRYYAKTEELPVQKMKYVPNQVPMRRSRNSVSREQTMVLQPVTREEQSSSSVWKSLFFGMFLAAIILAFSQNIVSFVSMKYDDIKYGNPRIVMYDFYVGHPGEDAFHKTHFVTYNNEGKVVILEIHPGDEHVVGYAGPILQYPNAELEPIFLEIYGDKKFPNIKVTVGGHYFLLINNKKDHFDFQRQDHTF